MQVNLEPSGTRPLQSFETDGRNITIWRIDGAEHRTDAPGEDRRSAPGASAPSSATEPGSDCDTASYPVVYLHVYDGNGADVAAACESIGCAPCVLVAVKPAYWNDDMTPWECPGLFAGDAPFAGHAKRQLQLLEREIIPRAEALLAAPHQAAGPAPTPPAIRAASAPRRMIAGYSLAGLFALWAPFNSTAFSLVASASGSLWYPGFTRFVAGSEMAERPERAYVSLGKKEAKTPSRLLRNVARGTDEVVALLREKGVPTRFVSNPGNHFKEPALRMARGIAWCLDDASTCDDAATR